MKKIMTVVLVIAAIIGIWSGVKKAYASEKVNEEKREVYDYFVYDIEYADFATADEIRDIEAHIDYMFDRLDSHGYCVNTHGECEMYENCVAEFEYSTSQGLVMVHACYEG